MPNNGALGQEKTGIYSPIEWETFGHIGNVPTGLGYTRVNPVEVSPTDPSKNNASYTVTRTYASPIYTTVIQKVINGTAYTKTIVKNTTTNIETISVWS